MPGIFNRTAQGFTVALNGGATQTFFEQRVFILPSLDGNVISVQGVDFNFSTEVAGSVVDGTTYTTGQAASMASRLKTNIFSGDYSSPVSRQMKKDYIEETPILAELRPGAITDALTPVVKNGAMTSATIAKQGNFDKLTVVNGDNTSFIRFTDLKVADNCALLKARVKVVDYQTNVAGDCILGLGFYIQQAANDTGGVHQFAVHVNITQKTAYFFNGSNSTWTNITTDLKTSAGALAVDGDTIEMTLQRVPTKGFNFTFLNVSSGEYMTGFGRTNAGNSASRNQGIANGHLRLLACNGVFVIEEFKAFASVPKQPLLGMMGDSYTSGDSGPVQTLSEYMADLNYYFVSVAGNGAYIQAMAQYQLLDILKLKPKYVSLIHILNVYYGYFDDGNANQVAFDASFNNIMKAITSYGGIPILCKWQNTGGYTNGNSPAWSTYVDAALVTYPTALVLDLRNENLDLTNGSHPSDADNIKIKNKLIALLASVGAIE